MPAGKSWESFEKAFRKETRILPCEVGCVDLMSRSLSQSVGCQSPLGATLFVAFSLAPLLIVGCGGSEERPELQPAQGTLLINGEPAEGATVIFHPASGTDFDARGTRPKGTVGGDGTFQVTSYQANDGIPTGDYQVGIIWLGDPESDSAWDKLGGRLADPKQIGLTVSVVEGENQFEPFTLEQIRLLPRPRRRPSVDYDQVD